MSRLKTDRRHLFTVTIGDCRVDEFRAGGKGGQAQNKKSTGIRIVHEPSGAVGESREERSQLQNKRTAFRRMAETEKFKTWIRVETARLTGEEAKIEARVERSLAARNLTVEVKDARGRWVPESACAPENGVTIMSRPLNTPTEAT